MGNPKNLLKSLVFRFTVYQYMIFFLGALCLASAFFYGFGASSLIPVAIAVITTTSLDLIIEYLKSEKNQIPNLIFFLKNFSPQSALISGLFIGGLLTQGLSWHIYVLAGAIAILSKHLIRFRQKHIFNPANLGILLVSVVFGVPHTWWISSPQILAPLFGIFIIWKLRRFDLAISFLISYFLCSATIELLRGSDFLEIYNVILNSGVVYFFSMFMLIEPKTQPSTRKQRVFYGMLVAALFIAFGFYVPKHDLPLALAVGNLFVPALSMKSRLLRN